jgi:hypothetical protein
MPLRTPQRDLTTLAQRIRSAHADCEANLQRGLHYALECGRYLIEAKSKVPYGEWIGWVREQCEMSEQLAQRYMRVAKHWPKLADQDASRVTHLSFRQALELIARNAQATTNTAPEHRGRLLAHAEQADYLSIGPSARELHEEDEERRRAQAEEERRQEHRRAAQAHTERLRAQQERRTQRELERYEQERRREESGTARPFDPTTLGSPPDGPAMHITSEGGYSVDVRTVHARMREVEDSLDRLLEVAIRAYGQDHRAVGGIRGLRAIVRQQFYRLRRSENP